MIRVFQPVSGAHFDCRLQEAGWMQGSAGFAVWLVAADIGHRVADSLPSLVWAVMRVCAMALVESFIVVLLLVVG